MGTFVLTACGDKHVARAAIAIRLLKHYCDRNIILFRARSSQDSGHDQTIDCTPPDHFDNVEVSRYLKTAVHRLVDHTDTRYCYIDNDVLAVSEGITGVFNSKLPATAFGDDFGMTVDGFSIAAINDYLASGDMLSEAIFRDFATDPNPDWKIWNSGVYVFDRRSQAFLDTWHEYAMKTFKIKYWATRDQGSLVAAAWHHQLHDQERLPAEYNWIVRHSKRRGDVLRMRNGSFLYEDTKLHFLHFIEKTYSWELAKALAPIGVKPDDFLLNKGKRTWMGRTGFERLVEQTKALLR